MEFDSVLVGGVANARQSFAREQLANDAPINLFILESEMPSSMDDLQKIQIELDTNVDDPLYREITIG